MHGIWLAELGLLHIIITIIHAVIILIMSVIHYYEGLARAQNSIKELQL